MEYSVHPANCCCKERVSFTENTSENVDIKSIYVCLRGEIPSVMGRSISFSYHSMCLSRSLLLT